MTGNIIVFFHGRTHSPSFLQLYIRNLVVYDSATVVSVYTKGCSKECLECISHSCGDDSLYGVWWESMRTGIWFPDVRESQAQCWESRDTMDPESPMWWAPDSVSACLKENWDVIRGRHWTLTLVLYTGSYNHKFSPPLSHTHTHSHKHAHRNQLIKIILF